MSKLYEFYECQECPYYQKYPLTKDSGEPDFYCRYLRKAVNPMLIDEDCKLTDGESYGWRMNMEYPNVIFFLKKQIEDLKTSSAIRKEIKEDAIKEFESAIEKLEEVK